MHLPCCSTAAPKCAVIFSFGVCRGLDILFSGVTHRARKFVLHTNVPGHPDFSVYAKCNFVLVFPEAGASSAGCAPLEPLPGGPSISPVALAVPYWGAARWMGSFSCHSIPHPGS
jgi:hypothetical protein